MNIIPYIRALLLRNQQAVVPGFGSFIIHQQPAQLNSITGELLPPKQEIKFNRNQQDDDGMLVSYLVKRTRLSKDAALEAIRKFAEEAKKEFDEKGVLILEGLGKLIIEQSGTFTFNLDDELFQREKFNELPRLKVPVRSQMETPPAPAPVAPLPKVSAGTHTAVAVTHRKSKWWIPAAILIVLVGLGTAGYLTGFFDEWLQDFRGKSAGAKITETGDKLVFGKRADTVDADTLREQISKELDERTSRQQALAYDDNTKGQSQPMEQQQVEVQAGADAHPAPVYTKPYHIIGGAFLIEENAVRLKERLEKKGADVEQFRHGNYYMLSLGSFDSKAQAKVFMVQLQEQFGQEFWVMHRQ